MIPDAWLNQAQNRLASHIRRTPLSYDSASDISIKRESQQITGLFKARRAANNTQALQPRQQAGGLVAASAGDQGRGAALVGRLVGAPLVIFVSRYALPARIEAICNLGADVSPVVGGYGKARPDRGVIAGGNNQPKLHTEITHGHYPR